jgi:very-short-patch-repair endonuclease
MKKYVTKYARKLRKDSTNVENKLWFVLRYTFPKVKFRRQQPIGIHIVDFVCFSRKLIIELDGGQHNFGVCEQQDKERDKWLKNEGFQVIRFWNNQVISNLEGVVEKIYSYLE